MARIVEFEGRRIEVPDDATDAEIGQILSAQPAPPIAAAPPAPVRPEDVRDPATGIPGGAEASSQPDTSFIDTIMSDIGIGAARPKRTMADVIAEGSGVKLAKPPMPERSALQTADGYVRSTMSGVNEGIANILDLPFDAVNNAPRLINLLPGEQGVPRISDTELGQAIGFDEPSINDNFKSVGFTGYEPQTGGEAAVNRIGKEVGAMAVPVGGVLGKAGQMTVQGARELPALARMFVEPAVVNPGRFVAKEATTALGAGMGAATANALVDPNTGYGQVFDLVGALLGGGVTAIGGAVAKGGKNVIDAVRQNPNYLDQVVKDSVVDRIGKAAALPGSDVPNGVFDTDSLIAAIENPASKPSAVIPGYQDSLADLTQNPGIAALEYGRAQGPSAGHFLQRQSANNQAVDAAMSRLEPAAPPSTLREALATERDSRIQQAIMGTADAEGAAEAATRGLVPQTTPGQRGGTVRSALETARDAARQRTDEAYRAVGIEGREVDPTGLTESLDNAVGGLTEVERGLVPQGVIDRVRQLGVPDQAGPVDTGLLDASGNPITRPAPPAEPVALKEATDLKSELQRLQRAAYADPKAEKGGRNAGRVLGQMIDAVDGYITRNITPEEQAALDTARGTKFEEAEAFGRQGDPVAAAVARNEGGVPKMRDDQVAGTFVNPQAMDRLFTQADTPAVRGAIRDELLSRGDVSSPERINRFLQDYGEQIDRFPGLRGEFETAAAARTREAEARGAQTNVQRDLGTPEDERGRSTVGRYLRFSDANPERAINEVLNAPDPGRAADELLTFVGDNPKAVEGARAAFWKKLRGESQSVDNTARSLEGTRAWRGDWLKSWLDNPATKAVAERLYKDKPEDLETLQAYADVLDNVNLRTRARAMGTSGTSQGVSGILTPETVQSRTYAWMRGQVSGTYLVTSMASVFARRAIRAARSEAIDRLTDKVLQNPELAKELLRDNNPANRAALARRAKTWLGNEASTLFDVLDDEKDQDDTTKAAMQGAR
ncbi:hypothetical protein [Rhizobium leguminosarum]|uniref:hypothetical protein n=1 Tax=Rhizobium leguminosarum TaxID=384 RepID=UPI001C90BDE8|nr:hypothetical protein [Rhizobium leguminosarum]MBY2969507.1 hypothetical protein [Rhizobium leguminosarum]MBY2976880.1 hypothetical protein [Rhizobium leguminosarum]MBY3005431.1 hypothetical protein [Rhizobium leguminosarum]